MRHSNKISELGQQSIQYVELLLLIIIAIATAYATFHEIYKMWLTSVVTVADLLLLFLYLEVLSMVKHYIGSGKLPVRYPLYIGIVALARYMVLEIKVLDPDHILAVSGAVLIMAIAVLVVRFGHVKFPYDDAADGHHR